MSDFKLYQRKELAELRPYIPGEPMQFRDIGSGALVTISVSQADLDNGSPKPGDMIARNPKSHVDSWLVAARYFSANFNTEPVGDADD